MNGSWYGDDTRFARPPRAKTGGAHCFPSAPPRSALTFALGALLATFFWWFNAYQTQVPECPDPAVSRAIVEGYNARHNRYQ